MIEDVRRGADAFQTRKDLEKILTRRARQEATKNAGGRLNRLIDGANELFARLGVAHQSDEPDLGHETSLRLPKVLALHRQPGEKHPILSRVQRHQPRTVFLRPSTKG